MFAPSVVARPMRMDFSRITKSPVPAVVPMTLQIGSHFVILAISKRASSAEDARKIAHNAATLSLSSIGRLGCRDRPGAMSMSTQKNITSIRASS